MATPSVPYSTATGVTISPGSPQTIHIVYVHGFRGDHTTFQTFPSDLHNYLLSSLPGLQTWVYPTYKSAKPLSFAVKNLLIWLKSLEDGPIILAGHSMGGLLVAEAVLSPEPITKRIVGLLAFDTPYLGMHPHVVVSGIASLLPGGSDDDSSGTDKKENKKKSDNDSDDDGDKGKKKGRNKLKKPGQQSGMRSEEGINDGNVVNFVNQHDAFPMTPASAEAAVTLSPKFNAGSSVSAPNSPPPNVTQFSITPVSAVNNANSTLSPISTIDSRTSDTSKVSKNSKITNVSKGSIVSAAQSYFQKHAEDPFFHFLNKHSDAPISAMTTWVIEYFEFGFAMFDYGELMDRYKKLEKWEGDWVNYWSVTTPPGGTGVAGVAGNTGSVREMKEGPKTVEGPHITILGGPSGDVDLGNQDKDEERPPTPKKSVRARGPPTPSTVYEDEFQRAMKRAVEKDSKRRGKSAERAHEKAQREKKDSQRELKATHHQETEARRSLDSGKSEKRTSLSKDRPKDDGQYSIAGALKLVHSIPATVAVPEVVIEREPTLDDDETGDVSIGDLSFVTAKSSLSPPSTPPPRPCSPRTPQHFITLPGSRASFKTSTRTSRNRWLKVEVAGVEDEVAAHCGLFIRSQNLGYDRFVSRVGELVKSWVH